MIAVLTQKLKAHTIEEGQQQQSFKVTHGWKDGEDSEDENQELVQIDRERRHQATSVVPVLPTSGRVRAGSRAGTASTGHDRPSSEEELESIIVARDCGLPGEKRKWCQVTGGGRMAPCGCGERASSSDEEVRDLCCSKAFRPIQQNGQDCGSPVLFGASPPRCLQPTARCPRGRFPCSAFEHASPCKRHKHIFADGGRRPSLDFEKMQQLSGAKWFSVKDLNSGYGQVEVEPEDRVNTSFVCSLMFYGCSKRMLLKKTSVPRTRVVKIRVIDDVITGRQSKGILSFHSVCLLCTAPYQFHIQAIHDVIAGHRRKSVNGGYPAPRFGCDPSIFSFRSLGTLSPLASVEEPSCA